MIPETLIGSRPRRLLSFRTAVMMKCGLLSRISAKTPMRLRMLSHPQRRTSHPATRLGEPNPAPKAAMPSVRYGFVVGFDEETGAVTHNLQDPTGAYAPITSAREHDGHLWLGSLTEPAVATVPL